MRDRKLLRLAALVILAFAATVGVMELTLSSADAAPDGLGCFIRCKAKGGSTSACAQDCLR